MTRTFSNSTDTVWFFYGYYILAVTKTVKCEPLYHFYMTIFSFQTVSALNFTNPQRQIFQISTLILIIREAAGFRNPTVRYTSLIINRNLSKKTCYMKNHAEELNGPDKSVLWLNSYTFKLSVTFDHFTTFYFNRFHQYDCLHPPVCWHVCSSMSGANLKHNLSHIYCTM